VRCQVDCAGSDQRGGLVAREPQQLGQHLLGVRFGVRLRVRVGGLG
jgi:hypothetical protein